MDINDFNKEYDCINVGQLKKLLENVPNDTVILTATDDADAAQMYLIDTHWHGAITMVFNT